ncbi:type II secretion system F family protein [archaeon]|nr:type II secretion system F family protein [archaeon]
MTSSRAEVYGVSYMCRQFVVYIGKRFSFIGRSGLLTSGLKQRLSADLHKARMPFKPELYFSACFGTAIIAASFSTLGAAFASGWPFLCVLSFASVFSIFVCYPRIKKRVVARGIESLLADKLRVISVSLALNLPFEDCLLQAADDSACGKEMQRIINESDAGVSVPKALKNARERTDSELFAAAVNQLSQAYSKSGRLASKSIASTADNAELAIRHKVQQFSAKLVIYSLAFIGIAAIVPSMVLAFSLIGSNFLSQPISGGQLLLLSSVVFPALDLIILVIIKVRGDM